jgi:hypothetical protein
VAFVVGLKKGLFAVRLKYVVPRIIETKRARDTMYKRADLLITNAPLILLNKKEKRKITKGKITIAARNRNLSLGSGAKLFPVTGTMETFLA